MSSDFGQYVDEIGSGLSKDAENAFLSCFKTLSDIEEQEPEWFAGKEMPKGQISTLASDGGVGKTTAAVDIAANRSAGKPCFLDPPDLIINPQIIAFLSTEDSVRKKLKRKLREAGGNMDNIIVPDFSEDESGLLRGFKFGTEKMSAFVRYYRPDLCIFDPLQGFIPPALNMGSRNAMRDCMAPLISLGEETGTTFLIICHTNKRKGAYGRDRIADSADLWDISRSVLMMGFTEDQGIRYLSHEKSNYGELQDTLLFSISSDGKIIKEGKTWKRDREFTQEYALNSSPSKRTSCEAWIVEQLKCGKIRNADLYDSAEDAGFSSATIRRAVETLSKNNRVRRWQTGYGSGKTWYIELSSPCDL